jgi:hypothetical protein
MRRFAWYAWKVGVPVLVAAFVGWYFYDRLRRPELWSTAIAFRPEWVIASALVYLIAYAVWGRYLVTLLRNQGAALSIATGLRTYFISQMGKYVPGKVLVIVIRIAMLGKRIGISRTAVGIASFYESVVWAGSGAAIGILLLPSSLWDGLREQLRARGGDVPDVHRVWFVLPMALAPIGLVGLSRFVNRVNRWRKGRDAAQLPRVKLHWVMLGILWDVLGWMVMGVSLLFMMNGLQSDSFAFTVEGCRNLISIAAIAYAMGFMAFFMPAGVGVRDIALQLLLAVELRSRMEGAGPGAAEGLAAIVAIVFRLAGTLAEVIVAGIMYRFAAPADRAALIEEVTHADEAAND